MVKRKRPDPKSRDFPAPPGPECSGLCDLPGAENFPEDSPTKQFYKDKVLSSQEEITQLKKKVKTLQQTKRRLVKRMKAPKKSSKKREQKLLSEEGSHVFSSVFSDDIQQLLCRVGNEQKGKYPPELRAFALTLHFYSPAAYEYVRSKFNEALPSQRTLRGWYKSIQGAPGFTAEAFAFLEKFAEARDEPFYCALIVDDMAIRKHVELVGDKVVGYVDFGTGLDDDGLPEAANACVFMIVGINVRFKMPVGYFLIDSLTGAERAELAKQCTEKLALLPQFRGASATSKFVRVFDHLFDLFNSRNPFARSYKAPLRKQNEACWKPFFAYTQAYIKGLRDPAGRPVLEGLKKTGFVGFLICMASTEKMFDELVGQGKLKYLLTHKLSQDHAENFFGSVRGRGGYNNNPTAAQFMAAYKRLLVQTEVTSSSSGNCTKDMVSILNATTVVAQVDATSALTDMRRSSILEPHDDHDYTHPENLSAVVVAVVPYIAGFVVRQVCKTTTCEECIAALYSDELVPLVEQKNRDGSLYVATPMDPLFFAVALLQKSNKFRPLEDFVEDNLYPNLLSVINSCSSRLRHVADIKELGEDRVYRYNESKCIAWLTKKVKAVAAALESADIQVGATCVTAALVRSKRDTRPTNVDGFVSVLYRPSVDGGTRQVK
ncbi:hypothetical protein HPB51_019084 [Rhipicephalus microplus]|uniref:Uncharacterized protein n=1 Tax=Rhipicephalus microplus TaxID=6941 RepID=A0A9J6D6S1_RHIMP|nr:hypothetical protein HPB51_019084 [Rhipicephalus microplus]